MASGMRPNIVLILADDMGYSDIGCFGAEIRTPNLDAMAETGLRYSQMYSFARCCPSRGALLTGLYPHQSGIGHMTSDLGTPEYQGYLRDDCLTIAEVLKTAGYRTMMAGKWHVGGTYNITEQDTWQPGATGLPTPRQRGFDRFYGTLMGAGNYFYPYTLYDNEKRVDVTSNDFYYTDAISDNAVKMIEEAHELAEPFFMYVAYTAPHWPLHALPEDIERYAGRYKGGWDKLRMERHETLKAMGVLDPIWSISPRDSDAPAWNDTPDKLWEDARMAVYAAQIDRMDQGIGQIRKTLQRLGIDDNTLVIFLSDNGGCAEFLAEDGWVQSFIEPLPDGTPIRVGNRKDVMPGEADTYMSYDLPWSNASNAPFRLFKHWVHEGGISSPCVVHYPDGIKEAGVVHGSISFIDVMATCVDLAGAIYPQEYNGQSITALEGESIVPSFNNHHWRRDRPIFWEHEGNCAVRVGDWKLVRRFASDWELYNMVEDRTELNNLAAREKTRRQEMIALYNRWAAHCRVMPWNPKNW